MFYKQLGILPEYIVDDLESMIMDLHSKDETGFQRIEFDQKIINKLKNLFKDVKLTIQKNHQGILVQKAFYSDSGITYPIHRDGFRCMSALNIAIRTNDNDWVRWYDSNLIDQLGQTNSQTNSQGNSTRNTDIKNIESVNYLCEFRPQKGEIYLINVDRFHTWHCGGPDYRLVIQTKFEGFPDIETVYKSVNEDTFKSIL